MIIIVQGDREGTLVDRLGGSQDLLRWPFHAFDGSGKLAGRACHSAVASLMEDRGEDKPILLERILDQGELSSAMRLSSRRSCGGRLIAGLLSRCEKLCAARIVALKVQGLLPSVGLMAVKRARNRAFTIKIRG